MSASAPTIPAIIHAAGQDGPPILLIHGFGADRLSWLANQHALSRAGRVYVLDLPGHGETTLAGLGGLDALVRAVERAVDGSGLGPAHIVGHSLGGTVAIAIAATRPDLVRSLALIAAAGLGRGVDERFLSDYQKCASVEGMEAVLRRLVTRPHLISRQMAARALEQLGGAGVRRGLMAIAGELRRIDPVVEPWIQRIAGSSLPCLAIWGAADEIIPPDPCRLERIGAESLILDNAAHLPQIESPRAVNERLVGWLTSRSQ